MNKTHNLGLKVLSLFDGMACGMLAMQKAGLKVDEYIAYEIDKYAIQTATHNFPMIKECRDVFKADFTQYKNIDYIVGGSPCVPAGSKIKTDKGYKNIEDMEIGDMVLTHKNRYKPVSRLYKRKTNHLYHIHFNGNKTLDITGNHPVYTYRNNEFQFIRTDELTNDDYICINIIQTNISMNYSDNILWLAGRTLADGYLSKEKNAVVIAVGKKKISEFESHLNGIHYYVCHSDRPSVEYVINDEDLVGLYAYFGNNKALFKHIPDTILNLPNEQLRFIFEGYISGDGFKRKDKPNTYMWSSSSEYLTLSMGLLTAKLFHKYPTISIRQGEYKKLPSGFCQTNINYNNQISITNRKNIDVKVIGDKILIKIKSIEKEIIETNVYNIETVDDHSYTVNNCIVHNCTYWSIAQKNNRETEASGLGWELFSQYVRAINEVKPKYFIYENNKSMSQAIRESISSTFGFEPICINSALVSAQNRQRLYWVGKRNEDGTYSKVDVQQPEDRGILLRDILESGEDLSQNEKSYCLTATYGGAVPQNTLERNQRTMVAEPVNVTSDGKAQTLKAQYAKNSVANFCCYTSTYGATGVAEPVRIGDVGSNAQTHREYSCNGKSVTINAGGGGMGGKTGLYAVPLETDIVPFVENKLDKAVEKYGYIPEMWNPYNNAEITDKAPTLTAQCASQTKSSTVLVTSSICYAVPCEWNENGNPIKAISFADGKTYTVYEVKDGLITIKGKEYPIKLADGYYIIRKLTVTECKRLQTVPEWYEFPVSDTQAYKMLGNGWSVDVIVHLIEATLMCK